MLRLALALSLTLTALTAQAGTSLLSAVGAGGSGTAAAFTGPGDVVSGAKVFVGLRAYTQAIANAGTQKLANVRRASDAQTCDFLVATNGGVGNSANCSGAFGTGSLSSFCNATTCTATKLYDQTGNANDVSQATVAAQPTVTLNCLGSLPCLTFASASSQTLTHASFTAVVQPFSLSAVADHTSTCASACETISAYDGSTGATLEVTSATVVSAWSGNITGTATTSQSAWHIYSFSVTDPNSIETVDGVSGSTYASGANGSGTALNMGSLNAASRFFQGNMAEVGLWPSAFSTTQATNMCHNQFNYWGTSVSC